MPARATAEQFQLFQRYQRARHGDGDMATMSFYDYRAMVEDTPIETFIVEFRDPDDRMVSACLADKLGDGLSAVYSFFAPALERRSLGTHAILWLIERARFLGLPYVYLGYWVPESRKMAYKSRFRPAEVLAGGAWRMLTEADLGDGVGAGTRRWCRKVRTDASQTILSTCPRPAVAMSLPPRRSAAASPAADRAVPRTAARPAG